VWLSPQDRQRYEGVEHEIADELSAYLLEHARRERLALVSRPQIEFRTDERLSLGEFGIQARLVREAAAPEPSREAAPAVEPAGHGNTMIYSTSDRHQEQLSEVRANRAGRAILVVDGRRMLIGTAGATIGRSRECDIVVDDANVSRRHAEVRPASQGWTIADLGSTNGVRVNGRPVGAGPQPLSDGDRVELGTAQVTFEID
jgi:predicted component of type VI protein secretion system